MAERVESLRNVFGEIRWLRRPWAEIELRPGADRVSAHLAADDRLVCWSGSVLPADWPDPRSLGSKGSPFFRQVLDLQAAMEKEDWPAVAAFYATYGWLGDPKGIKQRPIGERVGWCKHALAWFRSLVELTEILQTEDDAALWRWFEPCIPLVFGGHIDLVRWSAPVLALLDDGYSRIVIVPEAERPWPRQKDRSELYSLVWGAVIDAVQGKLATTHLEPIYKDLRKPRRPLVQWGFIAEGALDAAFLEWFFDVFAPFRVQICERPDCGRRVPRGRSKFCSRQCSDAHRQQRLRDRRRAQGAG